MDYIVNNMIFVLIVSICVCLLMMIFNNTLKNYIKFVPLCILVFSIIYIVKHVSRFYVLFDKSIDVYFMFIYTFNMILFMIPFIVSLVYLKFLQQKEKRITEIEKMKIKNL